MEEDDLTDRNRRRKKHNIQQYYEASPWQEGCDSDEEYWLRFGLERVGNEDHPDFKAISNLPIEPEIDPKTIGHERVIERLRLSRKLLPSYINWTCLTEKVELTTEEILSIILTLLDSQRSARKPPMRYSFLGDIYAGLDSGKLVPDLRGLFDWVEGQGYKLFVPPCGIPDRLVQVETSAQNDGPWLTGNPEDPEPKQSAVDSEDSRTPRMKGKASGLGTSAIQCEVFIAMKNLTPYEVSLTFVGDKAESGLGANNMLEISARGETRRVALATLDLVDRRRGALNSQGAILLGMAQKKKLRRTGPSHSAKISRLRKVFSKCIGIKDDPFERHRPDVGWAPRFKIADKRGAADERAKREAERRTDSYEQMNERGDQFPSNNQTDQSVDAKNDAADEWLKNNDPDAPE